VLERDDQADLLLVALRVLPESARRIDVQPGDQVLLIELVDPAAKVGEVVDGLRSGQVVVESKLTRQVAEPAVDGNRLGGRVHPEDPGPATGRPDMVEERSDHRRLAGAVGPQKAECLALLDRQVHLHDPPMRAVELGQLLGLDDRVHVGMPFPGTHRPPNSESRQPAPAGLVVSRSATN
jgi:hypothetical protein